MVAIRHPLCAGIDVHAREFVVCLRRHRDGHDQPERIPKRFGTTVTRMQQLRDWLLERSCREVVMESTGCYWTALHRVLTAAGIACTVGNPAHIQQIPGKKTDTTDAEWLADLHACGLVRPSLVPSAELVPVRELSRLRVHYIEQRTAGLNMITQRLEEWGIRLRQVVRGSGLTVQRILHAIAGGETSADELAALRHPRCQHPLDEFREVLAATVPEHSRVGIAMLVDDLDRIRQRVAELDRRLREATRPYRQALQLLMTIPGIGPVSAQTIIAECGPTMREFPGDKQLASFAGLCPGNHESAGKSHGGKTRRGNRYLRRTLGVAVRSLWQQPDSLPGGKLSRLAARIGNPKATVAVAHWMLRMAWRVLRSGVPYDDQRAHPGARPNGEREASRRKERIRRARKLLTDAGYTVTAEA